MVANESGFLGHFGQNSQPRPVPGEATGLRQELQRYRSLCSKCQIAKALKNRNTYNKVTVSCNCRGWAQKNSDRDGVAVASLGDAQARAKS